MKQKNLLKILDDIEQEYHKKGQKSVFIFLKQHWILFAIIIAVLLSTVLSTLFSLVYLYIIK